MTKPYNFFISYAEKDRNLLDEFLTHLTLLQRNGLLKTWNYGQVLPGQEWTSEIVKNLENADVIIFLISSSLLSCERIYENELLKAIEKYDRGEIIILPILLRPCLIEGSVIEKIQCLPRNSRPVVTWDDKDSAYLDIVKEIRNLLKAFQRTNIVDKKEEKSLVNNDYKLYIESDIPPNIQHFVGRDLEIQYVDSTLFKVVCITGIGGQGKSSLASYYLNDTKQSLKWDLWDWRDCKEESNRMQTKILAVIERFSMGRISASQLIEAENDLIVETLFKVIERRKILFVFDNVDSYIDLQTFLPTGILNVLIRKALMINHNSKFIFTCRPFVKIADVGFSQISLESLSMKETKSLFNKYGIEYFENDNNQDKLSEIYELTTGHPLWLSLIAAQAKTGIQRMESLVQKIKAKIIEGDIGNLSSILADNILSSVYDGLNERQKVLLRSISEAVKPENKDILVKMLLGELNRNQFNKALNKLKYLNLIVTKPSEKEELIELHPLVKHFIKVKYPIRERKKYITLIVNYYDKKTVILKESLSNKLSLKQYENWTNKVELHVNNNELEKAILTLTEISSAILTAGYIEEYLRVSMLLFDELNFDDAIEKKTSHFLDEFAIFLQIITQCGRYEEASLYLDRLQIALKSKDIEYTFFQNLTCYLLWFQGKYDEAIKIGEEGEQLLENSNLEDKYGVLHNLALARRDSGTKDNIDKALLYFLRGEKLDDVLDKDKFNMDFGESFYGNIGRCLQYLNNDESAVLCYANSYRILLERHDSKDSFLNIGYASSWIGGLMFKQNNFTYSYFFYKNAILAWDKYAPPKSLIIKPKLKALEVILADTEKSALRLNDSEIEVKCVEYIKKI